jgi:glyoxylase-like metal-dependent hydrolase (beta-lactamase superfamily II)
VSAPDDWTAPGAFEVAPGVFRMPLPLPNDGLKAVNVYAIATDDGFTLVDAGWAISEARDVLTTSLGRLGAGLGDVRRFLVTHVHRDHYTLAVTLRRELGARIGLGAGDRATLEFLHRPDTTPLKQSIADLRMLGADRLADRLAEMVRDHGVDRTQWELPDEWLREGPIELPGGRTLQAVETPGHTAGHLVFHDVEAGVLFAGDHVLPTITPSIGFEPVPTPAPLASFLRSLRLVRERPDAVLLPAHGPVAPSVHARVDELLAHHAQRLDETEAAADNGATTAYDVARCLHWTRRKRTYDELDEFNAMLAVFETAAHLDLLVALGRLTMTVEDGQRRYH